jgi:2-C-methyl-D-erythritol 4-phosphate cytidylyltransferase
VRTVALIVAVEESQDGAQALLAPLAGRPVAEHSIAAFGAAPEVDEIVLVAHPALAEGLRFGPGTRLVEAVGSRAESVVLAIEALSTEARATAARAVGAPGTEATGTEARATAARATAARGTAAPGEAGCHLLIHDAARPLVGPKVIADCATALGSAQAVCAAVPASDTMVRVTDGLITERPRRDRLRRRDYPQGFHLPVIRRAYRLALADPDYRPTDDCGVVLRYLPEVPVRLVPGNEQSFPVTTRLDVDIAETILRAAASG